MGTASPATGGFEEIHLQPKIVTAFPSVEGKPGGSWPHYGRPQFPPPPPFGSLRSRQKTVSLHGLSRPMPRRKIPVPPDHALFVQRVRDSARAKGWSERALALAAKMPPTTLRNYLTDVDPPRSAILAIAAAAGVDPGWLLTAQRGPETPNNVTGPSAPGATASQSTLVGAAGEHHVMAELLRRGYIAALAPQGVPNSDIVVTDVQGSRLCSIQVKARRELGSDGGWHMNEKHEAILGDRLFYCFVDFGRSPDAHPIVHLLPSAVVANVLTETHRRWLSIPGKRGRVHNDGKMRRLLPDYSRLYADTENPYPRGWLDRYRDRWEVLGLNPCG